MAPSCQMADARWVQKANALYTAWKRISGKAPPSNTALFIALCQAQFETTCGDAWPLAHNWGAVDHRPCNPEELAAIAAGTLKDGYWLYADGTFGAEHQATVVGVLHSDSHPTPKGPVWYHVWFGAFPDDVLGSVNFLHTVFRMVPAVLTDPNLSVETYVEGIYLHCYFEGTVGGARPCGKRTLPFTPPEQANVDHYAGTINRLMGGIRAALTGWEYAPPPPTPEPPPVPKPEPPAPVQNPTPEPPVPEPTPEPTPVQAPMQPHRPVVGWMTAAGAAVIAFWQSHLSSQSAGWWVLIGVGAILVVAVIVDVIIHLKRQKTLSA